MTEAKAVAPSGDQSIDGLLSGVQWSGHAVTFSFPADGAFYDGYAGVGGEPVTGFQGLTDSQMIAVRKVLSIYASVADIAFTEIAETATQHADIRFGRSDALPADFAWTRYPGPGPGGDVWLGKDITDNWPVAPDLINLLLHEIGHALGLKHGHETEGFGPLPASEDSRDFSVMTYRTYLGSSDAPPFPAFDSLASTPMMNDIAALQYLYGADVDHRTGSTTYSWLPSGELLIDGRSESRPVIGSRIFMTLWDAGGIDMLDLGAYATDVHIDLNPGAWTITSTDQLADLDSAHPGTHLALGNIYNPLLVDGDPRSLIENAVGGSGNDVVIGNLGNNYLFGQDGDDRLVGNDGNDWLRGDHGNDVVQGGSGFDTTLYWNEVKFFTITAEAGVLTVVDRSGVDGTDSVSGIEQFIFAGIDSGIDGSWLADASQLDPGHFADLVSLYVAYFDRAPDALGLAYWASRMVDGMSLIDIAKSFFVQPETVAAYPPGMSTGDFITRVYDNVLGRAPDPAGFDYWLRDLESGGQSRDKFVLSVINGARAASGSQTDAQYLANKQAVGSRFALDKGLGDGDWARQVMADVDGSAASVTVAWQMIDDFAEAAVTTDPRLLVPLIGVTETG